MFWQWVKQYMPRGLYGRAVLILLVPIVSIQLLVSVVFIQRHFNRVTEQMTGAVVLELGHLLAQVNAAASVEDAWDEIRPLLEPLGLEVALPASDTTRDARTWDDLTGGRVMRTLYDGLDGLVGVDLAGEPDMVSLSFDTAQGAMRVRFARDRLSAPNPHQLIVIMVVFSVLMTIIAYLFLRNQLRPIARLARAAEAFGRGEVVPYRLAGATEVRAAGRAFLDMRARIERAIESRTLMLSGVSHDLRTPLTRMKLSLGLMDDSAERAALERDVADMEALVEAFLAFARAEAVEGELEELDPADLLNRLVENAQRAGQEVEAGEIAWQGPARVRPAAVSRALENLIGNAVRYGTHVRISLGEGRRDLRFIVEDDGPGIAPADREAALKPFARLDAARNQDRGSGVGLGLAIAADIARGHGGRLVLAESEALGGLKAELILPQ